jgi:capsid protein
MWLSEEIAAGRVSAPGWADPRLRAAWSSHRFHGTGAPVIDPAKTMQASKMALELGATTIADVAQEYNDSDAESNFIKLRGEYANLPTPPWNTTTEKVVTGTETENDENEEKPQ